MLSERNIFLRDRRGPRSYYTPRTTYYTPRASSTDDAIVLTGIVQQGPDCVAFFENTQTGKTLRLQAGDPLGKGRVAMISFDTVHYACDGNLTRVSVGNNLSGKAVTMARSSASSSTASAPSAATAGPPAAAAPTAMGLAAPGTVPAPGMAPPEMGPPPGMAPGTAPGPGAPPPYAMTPGQAAPAPSITISPGQPPTAAPPAAAGPPATTTDSGAASILERLRQRREQELNK